MTDHPELFPTLKASDLHVTKMVVDRLPESTRRASLDLIESVRKYGVWHPLVVVGDHGGPLLVKDGQRRLDAARRTKTELVPVILTTKDQAEAVSRAVLQLHFTRKPSPAVEYLEIAKMEGSAQTIAGQLHISKTKVEQYLRLTTLPEPLHKAFCEERITWTQAQAIVKLDKAAQARLIEVLEKSGNITGDDIRVAQQVKRDVAKAGLTVGLFDGPTDVTSDYVALNTADAERLARVLDQVLPESEAYIEAEDLDFIRRMARVLRGIES